MKNERWPQELHRVNLLFLHPSFSPWSKLHNPLGLVCVELGLEGAGWGGGVGSLSLSLSVF